MNKRISVRRMLKTRIVESEAAIQSSHAYENMADVLGGPNYGEEQYRKTLAEDVEKLNYLLKCYDEKYPLLKTEENEI